jgi:photosystem II stability/assembly factor-like uncharacterized protein
MKKLLLLLLILSITSLNAQFWTPKATTFPATSRGISGISIVDASTVWVKAYDGTMNGDTTIKEYSKSSDGGNSWVSGVMNLGFATGGLGISSITAVSGTTAWVSAYPATGNSGGVWKTTNSGSSWAKQTSALFSDTTDSFTNFVYFWDTNIGICQGDPQAGYFEIYVTTNGGTNWTRVSAVNIPVPLTGEYGYTNNYSVVGSTIWFGTNKGRIYKSLDNGMNWTVAQSPITDFGSASVSGAFSFSTANKGILVTSGGLLYSTINGGSTWSTVSFSGSLYTGDIEYLSGTSKMVSTSAATNFSGSSYSLDDGLNWVNVDFDQHTTTAFFNATTGFSGGFSTNASTGGIFKYTGTVLPTDTFTKTEFSLFPNPSTNIITIRNANQDFNTVSFSDVNGRIIKKLDFASVFEKQISVADFNSGIYFVTLGSFRGNSVVKFIKN